MASEVKQVILVRRDLRLRRAALAALTAKASTEFFLGNDDSDADDVLSVKLSPHEAMWLGSGAPRIVLGVTSESQLRSMILKAELAGIQCYSVEGKSPDLYEREGLYETIAASLGPDESDKIDEITGNLKLL
jgi:peptidyl-tRNA hydrolase